MATRIRTFTRANGRDGYICGYQLFNGELAASAPRDLATFEMTKEGRREARMWRNGFAAGLACAAEQLGHMVVQPDDKPADEA